MIYRFIFVSEEVDDFFREIQISSSATFLDLSNAILESVEYPDDQLTSFFICEHNWEKCEEITRVEMHTSSEYDNLVMAETPIEEFVEEEKQRLIYIFDPLTERCFFIELKEIITGKNLDKAICSKKGGQPPKQTIDFDEISKTISGIETDETFYGDEGFDSSELDQDGYSIGGADAEADISIDTLDDLY
jgi:hypothetical protein